MHKATITINPLSMSNVCTSYYTTHDIFLSSALVTLGFRIEALDKYNKQKVEFCFTRSKALDEAVKMYWALEHRLEPQAFSANLKSLKNRIYSD